MKFEEIKTYEDAYIYAEEKGGIPKVPFTRLWQFICHNEEELISASKTMQEIFNLVDSECKFRIGEIKQIGESRFEVAISTGDSFEFKVGQTHLYNKLNAQEIEEKVAKAKKASPRKNDKNVITPVVTEEAIPEEIANAISEGIKKAEVILASAKEKEKEVVQEQPLNEEKELVQEQPLKEEKEVVQEQPLKEEVVRLKIFGLTIFEYIKK